MSDQHEQNESAAEVDDSFEALLKKAAHVSGPAVASLGLQLRPGSTLLDGRLRIVRRVGEGGMGVVYEAFDERRRSSVALKTLNRLNATNVYRLKNEFRSLSEVSHAGLCRLHELFSEGGQWFFTMELIDGERFDRWVRPSGALDEARLRAALPQLCEGIAAIHAAGKLHRDLKPSNVLVTQDGRVVVLDFGLAVDPELGGVGQTVMDDSVSGTPAYMAPEQAAGAAATAASDFYALGVMLFEALTGKLPFDGRVGEMLAAKQTRDAPKVSLVRVDAPADLATLCDALLARAPAQRPDAAGLRAQLGRAVGVSAAASSLRTPSSAAPRVTATSAGSDAAAAFLGRESELQALRDAHAVAVAGQAVVLFVSGESGMGKSALVTHFLDALRVREQATVLAGRCYERENVPFKGFDSVVDDLSRHLRRQSHAEASALMPREVFALARVFPVLDRIEAVARSPKKDIPDPHDLKRRAFDAFGELLGRLRDRSPLVVFIDDVQWLDQDSVRFMRALFVHAHPVPLLLVCAHRSEGADSNPLLQSVRQAVSDNPALQLRTLGVGPLPTSALVTLAARLLPSGTAAGAAQAFADEARGSPFFAAELARAAALRVPGAAPPSLAEAISLHIAALPLSAQRLLSLLALAGQPLPPDLAIEAVGLSDGHSLFDQLRSEQLVRVSIDGDGERSVECYHDKIREHVAGTLDGLGVRELSLGLSRALLAQAEPDAELLARCLHLAGEPAQAAVHAARAAEAAFSALAFERAVQLYADALQHGRFEPERELALRVGHARALAHAGLGERAAEAYLEAANDTPDAEAARELTRLGAEQYLMRGNLARGRAVLGQVLRAVGLSLPQSLPGTLASVAFWRTRLRLRGLSFTPRTEHDPATLRKLDALRTATHGLVRTDAALAAGLCARWVLCALQAGHTLELARALAWELYFRSMLGEPEARVAEADALCARLCEQTGDAFALHLLFYCRGIHQAIKLADMGSAIADFDRALEALAAHPSATSSYDAAWAQYFRTNCLLMLGRLTEAGELAHAQLDAALARGDHTVGVMLSQPAIYSLLAAGRPEQAERVVEQAIRLLHPGEVTLQDMTVCLFRAMPALYDDRALDGWRAAAPLYKRFIGSFLGRAMLRGLVECFAGGIAAAAAQQAEDTAERRRLNAQAKRFAKRARLSTIPMAEAMADPLLACLRGDRAGAIASLRGSIDAPLPPLYAHCLRRRLGELLGDDEGQAFIAEADAVMRAGGVVDPARFTAAVMAGIEIR